MCLVGRIAVVFSFSDLERGMQSSPADIFIALSRCFLFRSFPLGAFHSTDSEPHASPGLSECKRRKLRILEYPSFIDPSIHNEQT